MEIKRVLLTLLLLSLLNIGLLIVLLYRSSNWSGTYHALITYAIKQLQHLDYNVNATHKEHILGEKSLELATKNDIVISSLSPPSQYESDQDTNLLDDNMRVNNKVKPDRYVQIIKLQSKLPLGRFQKSLQNLKLLRKSHHSSKKPVYYALGDSLSTESVTIQVDNSSQAFNISEDFTFPHFKCILRDNRQMVETPWISELAKIMSKTREKMIFAITVNQGYKESLLNWLITAVFKGGVSLNRILVISMDQDIQEFLHWHKISCIYVPVKSLFNSLKSRYWIDEYGLVMFTRISVVRLLNHWGYSVVIIDTDALILQDPQPLFDKYPASSIIASGGTQPRTLYGVWNITVCNGLILLRSNQEIGKIFLLLILHMSSSSYPIELDNMAINFYALFVESGQTSIFLMHTNLCMSVLYSTKLKSDQSC